MSRYNTLAAVRGLIDRFGDASKQGATTQALIKDAGRLADEHEQLQRDLARALAGELKLVSWPCGHYSKPREFCPVCSELIARIGTATDELYRAVENIFNDKRFANSANLRAKRQGGFPVSWHLNGFTSGRYVDLEGTDPRTHIVVDAPFVSGALKREAGQTLCRPHVDPNSLAGPEAYNQDDEEATCPKCREVFDNVVARFKKEKIDAI